MCRIFSFSLDEQPDQPLALTRTQNKTSANYIIAFLCVS